MLVYDFINDTSAIQPLPLDGLNTTYHARGIGEIFSRSGWDRTPRGSNLIAGPYTDRTRTRTRARS